jgi:hypothetical protein
MSDSISNRELLSLIAIAHIDLSGVVILRLTELYGDLYSITFYENLIAFVSSYLSN